MAKDSKTLSSLQRARLYLRLVIELIISPLTWASYLYARHAHPHLPRRLAVKTFYFGTYFFLTFPPHALNWVAAYGGALSMALIHEAIRHAAERMAPPRTQPPAGDDRYRHLRTAYLLAALGMPALVYSQWLLVLAVVLVYVSLFALAITAVVRIRVFHQVPYSSALITAAISVLCIVALRLVKPAGDPALEIVYAMSAALLISVAAASMAESARHVAGYRLQTLEV